VVTHKLGSWVKSKANNSKAAVSKLVAAMAKKTPAPK
jgi:hypothetical protein